MSSPPSLSLIALSDGDVGVALAPALGVGVLPDNRPIVSLDGQLPLVVALPANSPTLLTTSEWPNELPRPSDPGTSRTGLPPQRWPGAPEEVLVHVTSDGAGRLIGLAIQGAPPEAADCLLDVMDDARLPRNMDGTAFLTLTFTR